MFLAPFHSRFAHVKFYLANNVMLLPRLNIVKNRL